MEDYIFIILAVILSIVSVLGRNKNKKVASSGAVPQRKPNILEQLLNENFFEQQVANQPSFDSTEMPASVVEVEKAEANRLSPFSKNESTERSIKPSPNKLTKAERIKRTSTTKQSKQIHELMKGFSLRKALIYSEIIDRKY